MPAGWSACPAARATGPWRSRLEAEDHPGSRRGGAPPAARLRARALPDRAPASLLAPRPAPQPAAVRAGRAARGARAWPPATSTRTRASAIRACRTPWWRCGWARRSTRPSPAAAATPRTCSRRPSGWPSASASTRTRWRRAGGWPSACASTSPRISATATRAPRIPTPIAVWPSSAGRVFDERYSGRRSREEALGRLDEELRVIRHLGLSGFFLLHRDMLELAREVAAEVRGPESARRLLPPGRGRGSSVSSIVCYLTGLSHVDPIENELLLGRFLNEELTALPDIDLDFPRDIRDVLIPRVHDRYGRDRCALVAAFATFQVRSAVRDFAKALGLPPGEIERLARAVDPWKDRNDIEDEVPERDPRGHRSPRWDALVKLARDAWGLPRHQSQHPGGMVISTQPLIDLCPVQPASMEGRQMVQWDKDSCGDAGFLKIDLLGLGMLSAVERCVDEIARVRDERIDLSRIPYDDQEVYARIQDAETTGRVPDRVARADADAQAHPAGEPRRPHGPGGAGAAGADRRRCGASLHREPQGAAGGSVLRGALPAPHARAGAARHARHDRLPGPGARGGDGLRRLQPGGGGGAATGDEPQALRGGDSRLRGEVHHRWRRPRRLARGGRAGSGPRSSASPASAFPRRTRPPSGCWPTSPPGCGCTTTPSSCAPCSTSSRWASIRPTPWCTRPSARAWRCCRRAWCEATPNAWWSDCPMAWPSGSAWAT